MSGLDSSIQCGESDNVDIDYLDVINRFFLVSLDVFNSVNNVHAFVAARKDRMLVITRCNQHRFAQPEYQSTYSQGVFSVVMKNWLPFVLGPAFAMLTV